MKLTVITTKYENESRIEEVCTKELEKDNNIEMQAVNIYDDVMYQTFRGFGGAFTDAAGYTFSQMSDEKKEVVLDAYFGEMGSHYTVGRVPLDSCDFSLEHYEAVSDETDIEMKSFSLERNNKYIIPFLLAAQDKLGKKIELLVSPWSPPKYMKTNRERNFGGKLRVDCQQRWADYVCRFLKEYKKLGLDVKMYTIQNEPNACQTWDSCLYTPKEEKEFVKCLYPTFVKNGLEDVKIFIWDHNKERIFERAAEIIDEETDKMIGGVAYHWYTGDHFDAVRMTADKYPDKEIMFSEGCVEYSRYKENSQLKNAQTYAHDIIGDLNAGTNTFIDWNLILDEKGGPNHVENYCDAPIMCNTKTDEVKLQLSYYYIRHFSRYIQPGAKRVGCSCYSDKLEMTAFKNPDGKIVAVIMNKSTEDMSVNLRFKQKTTAIEIAKESISTLLLQ